jgi:Zn-dependent peptidase ImmA (M78 family)
LQTKLEVQTEAKATMLLDSVGVQDLPVSLTELCAKLNIEIQYDELEALDGYFIRCPEGKVLIVVNDRVSLKRQRFSVAHEIGHAELRHGILGFSGGKVYRAKRLEFEANCFARELLMPKALLQSRGRMDARKIANLCNVSLTSARIREVEMGWV